MSRRKVVRSAAFLDGARRLFPPGGSASGRASFERFEELVLRGVELQFGHQFDDLPVAVPGVESIRHVMTQPVPLFPPLVVYGLLLTDGSIQLIHLEVDDDYWDLIAEDSDE